MKIFFIFVSLLLTLLMDLLTGNLGFSCSVTTLVLLYFAGSCNIRIALFSAVTAGMFLDMCYARPEAFSSLVLLISVGSGYYFMPKKEYRFMLIRSLPAGAAAGGVTVLGNAVAVSFLYGKTGYPSSFIAHLITAMIFGMFLFPLLIILLDAIAVKLNLPAYLSRLPADINPDAELPIETATGRRRKRRK